MRVSPGQTDIQICRRFVKGCKRWFKVIAYYGNDCPATVGEFFVRQPPTYARPVCPSAKKPTVLAGCPPDPNRGRHWNRKERR